MKLKQLLLLISLTLFSIISFGQTDTIAKKKYQVSQGAGYAQAVLVDNVLYISGTVASGDMAAQRSLCRNRENTKSLRCNFSQRRERKPVHNRY